MISRHVEAGDELFAVYRVADALNVINADMRKCDLPSSRGSRCRGWSAQREEQEEQRYEAETFVRVVFSRAGSDVERVPGRREHENSYLVRPNNQT